MSTPAMIFQEQENGTSKGIFVHADGYTMPHIGVGYTLWNYYSDRKKVSDLLDLGHLASLGKEVSATFVVKYLGGFSWYSNEIFRAIKIIEKSFGYKERFTTEGIYYEYVSENAATPFKNMNQQEVNNFLYEYAEKILPYPQYTGGEKFKFERNSTPFKELDRNGSDSTVAYHRDRGDEKENPVEVSMNKLNLKEPKTYGGEQFQYLQRLDSSWYYRKRLGSFWGEWKRLASAFSK
ncbi:hypothetical protein [Enterococcus sp. BWR-S5]|uniref:hypothetical protein n=1 Tax=Enterococcus sp. BWR-S5 TaxID=2787714 RepID=UPI0019204581|nr:hypothetical protein [Enterococcus sp. BWR-S5]MBL1227237.1 hypothetical protein [Enterococcus sp. BWR-S5]